jgi:vacuole morphology and inheritance protein 14
MVFIVKQFRESHTLLERRGTLAVRRLCTLLGAEKVYRELATILEGEADLEFATIMVQVGLYHKN